MSAAKSFAFTSQLTSNSHASNSSSCSTSSNMSNTNPLSTFSNLVNNTYKCTYCQNNLGSVSIKCNECQNFYLCLKVTYFVFLFNTKLNFLFSLLSPW